MEIRILNAIMGKSVIPTFGCVDMGNIAFILDTLKNDRIHEFARFNIIECEVRDVV